MNHDWQLFIKDISWFLKPGEVAEVGAAQPPGSWTPASPEFGQLFPQLEQLLREAFVTAVSVSGTSYELYRWSRREGGNCGWLSLLPSSNPPSSLYPQHHILLSSFGGIIERFNESTWWVLNHNDALTEREAQEDAAFIGEHYRWPFDEAGLEIPVDLQQFYSIAREANGNTTFCHRLSGEILLFAPDHAFDHIEPYPGCPEYTLYRLPEAPHFRDWVNVIAQQWRAWIEDVA